MRPPRVDLSYEQFGKLLVLKYVGGAYWECVCTCGGSRIVRTSALNSGRTTHCNACRGKHRMHHTPEYQSWVAMRQRCFNINHPSYPRYGGRGITVCKQWIDSFEQFYLDVGPRPSHKHSLDRFPNNRGNYEPENVRWATGIEQIANRYNTHFVAYGGERLPMTEWARRLHINAATLFSRIQRGWTVEEAFKIPLLSRQRADFL